MIVNSKVVLKRWLFGLTVPQQYVCVARENFAQPIETTLTLTDGRKILMKHIFLGYKPVVLAFFDEQDVLNAEVSLEYLQEDAGTGVQTMANRRSVARMTLMPLQNVFQNARPLKLYQAVSGEHTFISRFHQWTNALRNRFTRNKPGNVDLEGSLYDMVRIAYSLPQTIAVVSVHDGEKMNLFPTDLHGSVNNEFYLSSLRLGGKAQQQVESVGRVVIAEVDSSAFRQVYSLGKNHMKDMSTSENFSLLPSRSRNYGSPLHADTLRYVELKVLEFIDVGIHRIYLYKIENRVEVRAGETLAHIHQYYAQWREDHGIETIFHFR